LTPETKSALAAIHKEHGKASIMFMGDTPAIDIPCISTGSLSLDVALGGKGFPKGRIIEVFGPESSGKTTLCLHAIAEAQKHGLCAIVDAEHAMDPSWARKLGVNVDELLVAQPDNGEEALEITKKLVDTPEVSMIVVDSVAALVPKKELDGEIGDSHVGLQARMMAQAMRVLVPRINQTKTIVIFINQIRMKIGVMFGSPETTPGGQALKFAASCRVDIRRIKTIGEGDAKTGHRVRAKVIKNKVAPPFREAEFDLLYDRGIDRNGEIIDLAVKHNLLTRSGAWLKLGETMVGNGRDKARDTIEQDTKLRSELEALLTPILNK
jgi:recombination protein RecA